MPDFAPPISLSNPSFPRRRESRRLQPILPPEIRRESRATNPFPLYGLTGVGLRLNSGTPKPRWGAAHPHPNLLPSREKGFLARDSYLISGSGLGSQASRPLISPIFAGTTKIKTYPYKPLDGGKARMGCRGRLARVLPPATLPLQALYGGRLGWARRPQARPCGRDARAPSPP